MFVRPPLHVIKVKEVDIIERLEVQKASGAEMSLKATAAEHRTELPSSTHLLA